MRKRDRVRKADLTAVSFRVKSSVKKTLDQLAKDTGMSRTFVIEAAIMRLSLGFDAFVKDLKKIQGGK